MGGADDADPAAVLLVDHGSRRDEANALLDDVAHALAERLPGRIVRIAHLEIAAPSIAEGIDACVAAGARSITVLPWFLGPGRHTRDDIPAQVTAATARHPGVTAEVRAPLGLHPKMVDVLLARLDERGG